VLEAVRQSVVRVVPRPLAGPPAVGLGREDDVEGAYRLVGRNDEAAEGGGGREVGRYRAGGVAVLLRRAEDAEGGRGRHPPGRAALRTRQGRDVDGGRRGGGSSCGVFHRRRGMMMRMRGRR
jgi:hypothetical protein